MIWDKVQLKEITNNLDSRRIPLNNSQRAEKKSNPIYPYIGANKIMDYVDEYIFDEKILCVAEDGGNWGHNETCSVIYDEKVWVNNHAHVLTAKNKLILEYLKYYLNYTDLTLFINGATRGKLTKTTLNSIPIPLPSLETQKKIAAILDEADKLRQLDKQLIEKYDAFTQSLFLDMFGDPVANQKDFETVNINHFIDKLESGKSVNSTNDNFITGNVGILKTSCVYNGIFDIEEAKVIRKDEVMRAKLNPKKDSIIISRMNTEELVGKSAYIDKDYPNLFLPDRLWQSVKSDVDYSVLWLSKAISYKSFMKSISRVATGTSGSMKNISQKKFLDLKIIKPPIKLQNQFAERVQDIEAQKAQAQQSLIKSEELFNSLLQKAFNGELV